MKRVPVLQDHLSVQFLLFCSFCLISLACYYVDSFHSNLFGALVGLGSMIVAFPGCPHILII